MFYVGGGAGKRLPLGDLSPPFGNETVEPRSAASSEVGAHREVRPANRMRTCPWGNGYGNLAGAA